MGRTIRQRGAVRRGRLLAGAALACAPLVAALGCFGGGRGPAVITSNDPASKIPAIKRAVDVRATETAPQLVRSLESEDPAVRFYAIRGLQDLTGETFGYVWYAGDGARAAALQQWKQWLDRSGSHDGSGDGDNGTGLAGGKVDQE